MHWLFLIVAGIMEVGWAFSLKHTQGFTKIIPMFVLCFLRVFCSLFLESGTKALAHEYGLRDLGWHCSSGHNPGWDLILPRTRHAVQIYLFNFDLGRRIGLENICQRGRRQDGADRFTYCRE